jgi:hypothetical protein
LVSAFYFRVKACRDGSTGLEMTHDLFSVHPGKVYETNRDDASSCNALLFNESIEALYYMPWSSEIELTKRG